MNLNDLKSKMDTNGSAYFNKNAFYNKTTDVCYIPENAEDLSDTFTYMDLKNEVEYFLNLNPSFLKDRKTTVDNVLVNMFENLIWEFPSTYLVELADFV